MTTSLAAQDGLVEALRDAAWYYMSQIGQGYMAHNLPFTRTQKEADERLRAALASIEVKS